VVHFCIWGEGEKQADVREASTYGKWSTAYESDANCSWSKALRGCRASMKASFFDFSITCIVLGNWKSLPLTFNMRKQTLPTQLLRSSRLSASLSSYTAWLALRRIYHAASRSPHITAGLRVGPCSQRTIAAQNLRGLIEFSDRCHLSFSHFCDSIGKV
jgi:hypothetical protein